MSEKIEAPKSEKQDSREDFYDTLTVPQYLQWSKNYLKREFDIDDLSTIEGVHLRRIVEECMKEEKKDRKDLKAGELSSAMFIIEVEKEASARWLRDVYDIYPNDIQYEYKIWQNSDWDNPLIYHNPVEYHDKIKELDDRGEQYTLGGNVAKEFKEYLKKLRAESHLI